MMEYILDLMEEESISLDLSSYDPEGKHKNRKSDASLFNESRNHMKDDFGLYELRLLALTQLGYIPVAAAMLMTTFMEPSQEWCQTIQGNSSNWYTKPTKEFYSLTVQYDFACQANSNHITAVMSSLLMWGALLGSFICGFASDKFGRKPVYLGCLGMVTVGHLFFASSSVITWLGINAGLAFVGFFCGGYMVTNFVILTEAFELPRSRLLVVSLNGWSISMAITAALAYTTQYWLTYHLFIGIIGILLVILSSSMTWESCRWLSANGMHREAKKNSLRITVLNNKKMINEEDIVILEWYEILGFSAPTHTEEKKTWKTLFKSARFLKPTVVMFYSFLASSIVSFGFYFSIDVLPGDRYLNMGIMGLLKFVLGFTPFVVNQFLTKRAIAISSVGLCCIAAFLILPIQYYKIIDFQWIVIVLSLFVAAGIDPTWKINHLYSTELFPTSVRSMARGVCNAGGRLGSVMAPMIVYMRTLGVVVPNTIFAALLLVQLIVFVVFLPDDNDREANEINDE